MKTDVNFYAFEDAFKTRERKDTFSYKGLRALYDYLLNYEEDTDEEIELDVIALCCEYTEYESLKELQKDYTSIETMEGLQEQTQVIEIEGTDGFIIQVY